MDEQEAIREAIRRIREAVMGRPLKECCDSVVDEAKRLTGADNGRLRFVDYTGTRLVPEAIRGALREEPELAVRERGICIVGRADRLATAQRVNDVQIDEDFIAYKRRVLEWAETAERQGRHRMAEMWRNYLNRTLAELGSEMTIPILAGTNLLGILSVNAFRTNAFFPEHETMLCDLAREVAVALLNRNASTLEDLHKTEIEMASVFELEKVAQHLAEGMQRAVEGSIPNIFLYDEGCQEEFGSPFRFLAGTGATEEERMLGAFPPRSGGMGKEAIDKHARGEDSFVVEEYAEEASSHASPTARDQGIKTIGCLALIFRARIVGVVYLHFRERHFFTQNEKRMLDMFAGYAAIAVINASALPSYAELYGNQLTRLLAG